MPRIPYLPENLRDPADVVGPVRARRGGTLLHLDRMLLHSPPLTRGWNALLGAVRSELELDARLRELVTCAVALMNGAEYELHHHLAPFLAAGGTEAQLDALRRGRGRDDGSGPFDEVERACLRVAEEMTRGVALGDATFAEARRLLGARGTVELVGVVAAYNMVSRFLVALEIGPE
jgi:alkylhydroperoxidase family enzyme